MATVVIDEQGAQIGYKNNQLVIQSDEDNLSWGIPKHSIERLLVVGRAQIQPGALDFLLRDSIPCHFMTTSGRYKGQLAGIDGKNVFARMRQYDRYQQMDYRNGLARIIVRQKVDNLRYFLAKHNRYNQNQRLEQGITRLKALLQGLDCANSTDEIRGIEGSCAATYFAAFGAIFEKSPFTFSKRTRRPPLDPINAMLSLGYTLVLSEIVSAVQATGLDAYVGYLHSAEYGRPSLACDLQEEFRFIVDELVVRLVNLKQVKPDDFETAEDGAVNMSEEARETYYRAWERKIREGAMYDGRRTSYRRIIQHQTQRLARSLFENQPSYQPFKRPQN